MLGDNHLGSASSSCSSFSPCIFQHSLLRPSSPEAYGDFHAPSLLLSPGLDPHSRRTQKRCLELQAAEPGRKIWSDEGRKTSFSSRHRPLLPLSLTGLLVEQAQENAALRLYPSIYIKATSDNEKIPLTCTEQRFLFSQGESRYMRKENLSLCICKGKYCETGKADIAASQVEHQDAIFDRPPSCA